MIIASALTAAPCPFLARPLLATASTFDPTSATQESHNHSQAQLELERNFQLEVGLLSIFASAWEPYTGRWATASTGATTPAQLAGYTTARIHRIQLSNHDADSTAASTRLQPRRTWDLDGLPAVAVERDGGALQEGLLLRTDLTEGG
jgi:hypothetical protein